MLRAEGPAAPAAGGAPAALRATPGLGSAGCGTPGRGTSGERGAARGAAANGRHFTSSHLGCPTPTGRGQEGLALRATEAVRKPPTRAPAGPYAQRVHRHGQAERRAGGRHVSAVIKWPLHGCEASSVAKPSPDRNADGYDSHVPLHKPPIFQFTPSLTLTAHLVRF